MGSAGPFRRDAAEHPAQVADLDLKRPPCRVDQQGVEHDFEVIAGILIADATRQDLPITYVSPGFEQLTGYPAEQVLGRNCRFLQGPATDPRAVDVMRRAIAAGREAYVTLLNYRADGTPFWNEVALAPERDPQGRVLRYLGVQKDVSRRIRAEARIRELAYYDSLTGLANRASFRRELGDALQTAAGSDSQLALLFLDIDDFKLVNDTYGHSAGDELLRALAKRLRGVIRPGDVLARQGGDEFLLLVRGVKDAASVAGDVAGRVLEVIREPFQLGGVGPLEVRASVGISSYPGDASDAEELERHADEAMYRAKAAGKDGCHVYRRPAPGVGRAAADAFNPAAGAGELGRILRDQLVVSLYQPIVEIQTGRVVAYEALARGPGGSPLERPDRLFAAARAAGRVTELDWLCRIAAVRGALAAGIADSSALFINCEPSAIGSECPTRYLELWERAQRELDLVLEITERAVTDRPAELARLAGEQRREGRGIAIDDLGADQRSLALLPLLEPDVIKLDLRLVQNRPSVEQASIMAAVCAEHERTGAAILAEGVESEDHMRTARALGATLGQGWLWGRPAPLPPGRPAGAMGQARSRFATVRSCAASGEDGADPRSTPFQVVAAHRPTAEATKALLLPISHHLENRALRIGEGAVILSAFQDARHFTRFTARRYRMLVRNASLVAAFGVGLAEEPVKGVRGARLEPDDPLAGEWSVIVIGPHFAGALVAVDLGDSCREPDRRFLYATSYDRALVIEGARTLLHRITALREPRAELAV